jgi:2-polyprenyl-3-methyl-5-hydroxy-6-metoxy-1,4-benzoquinol methylase
MRDEPTLSAWRQPLEDLDFLEPDTWYKGQHCHKFPYDRPVTVEDVLYGWRPAQKLIIGETRVLAFGSCFAEYFVKFLAQRGYNRWQLPLEQHSHSEENLLLALPVTFENIFVIVQQVRWAFGEFTPAARLWYTKDKAYFEATEERRDKVRRSFEEGDVFVLTLGLSEVWFDRIEDEPMWRTIPSHLYEPDRHVCRPVTVAETLAALYELDRLAERFLAGKRFIFTLSPIPLIATFRDQSPITANQSSKAILRAALDEFLGDSKIAQKSRYHYFPSYELVFHMFERPFLPDNRHIRPEVAGAILDIFSDLYTDLPIEEPRVPKANLHVLLLERQVRELEAELEKKERVIRELDQAARERLELIHRLAGGQRVEDATERGVETRPTKNPTPGLSHFSSAHYQEHNRARLDHLQSLGLPLPAGSRVLELGSGPGDHTGFYIARKCSVVAVDARRECLDVLAQRFPGVRVIQCDLSEPAALGALGTFEIIHCYGILYHLENPEPLLRYIGDACSGFAVVETCVSPARTSAVELVDEIREDYTQSSTGRACRPTREWVFHQLSLSFSFVYLTRTQPDHSEFPTDWTNGCDSASLVRSVFVASKRPLDLPALSPKLLDIQGRFRGSARP